MRWFLLLLLLITSSVQGQETPTAIEPAQLDRMTVENTPTLSLYAAVTLRDVSRVMWSPGGFFLAGTARNIIYLYDMRDLSLPPRTFVHNAIVKDLAFHPDGNTLATSAGGGIHLWDVETATRRDNFDGDALHLAYSPDGNVLAYLNTDGGLIYLLSVRTRQAVPVARTDERLIGMTFSPNGGTIVAGTDTGNLMLWNAYTYVAETLGTADAVTAASAFNAQDPVNGLAFSDDGRFLISVKSGLTLWDARARTVARILAPADELHFEISVNTRAGLIAAVSGDYLPGENNQVQVWHLDSGVELASVRHGGALSAAFNPSGTIIASAGANQIYLWAAQSSLPAMVQAKDWSRINVIAYCDTLEQPPGTIVPYQSISLVWSWYATTPELVRDHVNAAQYSISLNGRALEGWRYLTRTEADPINDNLPTVYWYMPIGGLPAGDYTVNYVLRWSEKISDGLVEFGPGSANPQESSSCTFSISE